jgi:hypothetical protein
MGGTAGLTIAEMKFVNELALREATNPGGSRPVLAQWPTSGLWVVGLWVSG